MMGPEFFRVLGLYALAIFCLGAGIGALLVWVF